MHKGLGKTFSLEQSVPEPSNIVDCDMLRQYALESEVCHVYYVLAHDYYTCVLLFMTL